MNAGEHVPAELLEGYRARTLSAAQLAAVANHFAACAECRAAARKRGDEEKLAQAFAVGDPHLSYEELEKLAEKPGAAHPHLAGCDMCAGEWRDLKSFRDSLQKPGRPRVRVMVPALVAVAAAFGVVMLPKHSAVAPTRPAIAATVAAIQDGGRSISLDTDGVLHGLDSADRQLQLLAKAAITTGKLPAAAEDSNLIRRHETLLGAASDAEQALKLLSPTGTVVASGQPDFIWRAKPQAGRFVVSVYSSDFRLAAKSPELLTREWKCPVTLTAGGTYLWTVSAVVGGRRVLEPHSPEPDARFRVATASEADEFKRVTAIQPTSDLALAVVAARLGMRQEAQAALARLAERNPGSDLPSRLETSVQLTAK